LHFGVTGQVRLNAKMARAPGAQDAHRLDEFLAGTGKRVGNLGRRRVRDLAPDDAVCFELPKLSRQDFFAHPRQKSAKLSEALGTEAQMPDSQDLPFPTDGIDGALHRATVMVLQNSPPGLQKCAYFRKVPDGYTIRVGEENLERRGSRAPRRSRRAHPKEAET
jgi:hypothetical protein